MNSEVFTTPSYRDVMKFKYITMDNRKASEVDSLKILQIHKFAPHNLA